MKSLHRHHNIKATLHLHKYMEVPTISARMEMQLRRVRNETLEEMQSLQRTIERCQSNVARLKAIKSYNPGVLLRRNQEELQRAEQQYDVLEKRLGQLEDGSYAEQLQAELDANRRAIEQKTAATRRRKEGAIQKGSVAPVPKRAAAPPTKRPTPEEYRAAFSSPYFRENAQEAKSREMDYAEKQYYRDCQSVPTHLTEKLKNMPSNLGYLWRDIWCMGEKPAETNREVTLFEKRGSQFLIHTYTYELYTLHEKDANTNRRRLVEKRERERLR